MDANEPIIELNHFISVIKEDTRLSRRTSLL